MSGTQPTRYYSPIFTALVRSGKFADMSEAAVRVLIVLDCHCNDTWTCHPNYETLREKAGFGSDATIAKGLKELISLGVIEVSGGLGKNANHYRLILPAAGDAGTTASVEQEKACSTLGEPLSYTSRQNSSGSTTRGVDKQEIREQDSEQEKTSAGGGAGLFPDDSLKKNTGKRAKEQVLIPGKLAAVQGFREAWAEWIEYRKQRRLSMLPMTLNRQLKILSGEPDAVGCIEKSIANGWQGLFETKGKNHDQKQSTGPRQFEAGKQQPGKFDRKPKTVVTV